MTTAGGDILTIVGVSGIDSENVRVLVGGRVSARYIVLRAPARIAVFTSFVR